MVDEDVCRPAVHAPSRGGGAVAVVQMINSLQRGGSEGQAVQLARALSADGRFRVTLACLNGAGPLRREVDDSGLDLIEFPLTSLHDGRTARQLWRFMNELRRRQAKIVHTHDVYSNIFGLPAAWIARTPVRIGSRRDIGGVVSSSKRCVERATFGLAHAVVVNADAIGRDLVQHGVRQGKVVTIHNAVDGERVIPTLSRGEALRSFGLPERRYVVLVANLAHRVKDHPTFLRAAARVASEVPDTGFVVAGDGPLAPEMRRLAASLGIADDVFFVGACSEIGNLLSVAEVGVLSSAAEGLSNAVLEYMAAGKPVVASDVGGMREAVFEAETGYLAPAGDDRTLAKRVVALLQDPQGARAMGERGQRRAREGFSTERLVERTVRLYETLLYGESR